MICCIFFFFFFCKSEQQTFYDKRLAIIIEIDSKGVQYVNIHNAGCLAIERIKANWLGKQNVNIVH